MSSFVRIRLSFQRSLPLAETQNSWFLFDTAKCSTIADLEYLIKERFEGLKSGNNVINLYLDEYLLPSQEKIELIQQNDNIRVELKQITTKWSSEEDDSYQDTEEKVKRKKKNSVLPDVRSKSKQTSKKMSPSPSTSHVTTQNKSDEKSKGKNSKISEKKHKTSHPPPTQPSKSNVGKRKNNDEPLKTNAKISKTSRNKMEKYLHAGKDVVGCDCYSTESSSSTVSSSSSSSSSSSDELHSKACALMNGKKSTGSKATKDDKSSVHGVLGKDVKNKLSSTFVSPKGNKRMDAKKIASKSLSALQVKNKGNCASKSSSSSSESSETEESESTPKANKRKDANKIASKSLSALQGKNKGNCASKASSSSSESSETEESESILKRDATKTNISSLSSSLSASLTSPRLSSEGVKECAKIGNTYKKKSVDMIRKDNIKKKVSSSSYYSASTSSSSEYEKDDSNIEDIYKNTDTLLYPLSSSSLPLPSSSSSDGKQWDTTVTSVNQSVRSNLNQKAECSGQVNVLQRTSKTQKEKTGASLSTSHIRFDSEDETIDEQEEVCSINNVTDDFNNTRPDPSLTASKQNDQTSSKNAVEQKEPAQKDYSVCTPLHGPPRNKDKIAYKVLELSASYTPEVSAYKEGTVLSYEPNSGTVTIELTKESLKKTQGDGNVSRKFELVYEDDQENEETVNDEEPDPEVIVLWSSMLDPMLISD